MISKLMISLQINMRRYSNIPIRIILTRVIHFTMINTFYIPQIQLPRIIINIKASLIMLWHNRSIRIHLLFLRYISRIPILIHLSIFCNIFSIPNFLRRCWENITCVNNIIYIPFTIIYNWMKFTILPNAIYNKFILMSPAI
jgi:hypothetical protein